MGRLWLLRLFIVSIARHNFTLLVALTTSRRLVFDKSITDHTAPALLHFLSQQLKDSRTRRRTARLEASPFGCEMLETKTLLLPSGVNLRITPSLALKFLLLRETKRFPKASTAMPSTSKSVANVVLIPDGVIFLIELALPLPTKRFPLGSNTIVSGFEIPANVFSVKMMSSVEENSSTTSCRRAPTSKLVAAYPMSERNTVAKQATANLRYVEAYLR